MQNREAIPEQTLPGAKDDPGRTFFGSDGATQFRAQRPDGADVEVVDGDDVLCPSAVPDSDYYYG